MTNSKPTRKPAPQIDKRIQRLLDILLAVDCPMCPKDAPPNKCSAYTSDGDWCCQRCADEYNDYMNREDTE